MAETRTCSECGETVDDFSLCRECWVVVCSGCVYEGMCDCCFALRPNQGDQS